MLVVALHCAAVPNLSVDARGPRGAVLARISVLSWLTLVSRVALLAARAVVSLFTLFSRLAIFTAFTFFPAITLLAVGDGH